MTQSWPDYSKAPTTASPSTSRPEYIFDSSLRRNRRNVFLLLSWREISPQTKKLYRKFVGGTLFYNEDDCGPERHEVDAKRSLASWVEADSLQHLTATYCPLLPPPRSTIAAAFSSDGKTLASTHGDHTVKITDCQTGKCLKVLSGHRRTPWVVRFHPLYSQILASGSLDHEVRLWDANTDDCICSHDFYRPIASIAFHAQGEFLAVASGHKLFIWNYKRTGEASSPAIVLKTRRSLRAVHFHPHAAPFLLTAEVNYLDSSDSPLTLATSSGYLKYPPPAIFISNSRSTAIGKSENSVLVPPGYMLLPAFTRDGGTYLQLEDKLVNPGNNRLTGSSSAQQRSEPFLQNHLWSSSGLGRQNDNVVPMEISPVEIAGADSVPNDSSSRCLPAEIDKINDDTVMNTVETFEGQSTSISPGNSNNIVEKEDDIALQSISQNETAGEMPLDQSSFGGMSALHSSMSLGNTGNQVPSRIVEAGQIHQFFPLGDPGPWALPCLQGWLMGQRHASLHPMLSLNNSMQGIFSSIHGMSPEVLTLDLPPARNVETSSSVPVNVGHMRAPGRSSSRHRSRSRLMDLVDSEEGGTQNDENESQFGRNNVGSEVAASLVAAAAAELPCTVKLRIWLHDIQNPCAPLDSERCRLTIPHAVLCSEMGAHFSPCGRFLAACVACLLPHMEVDHGLSPQIQQDAPGAATSPTRHPISSHQVMYELRVYSLEEITFGMVLASRAIRAAHCLTSIQFSPTSEHILLAYGRRHSSLLRSVVCNGETTIPIYTILEVYRASDMELVRVLPSAEDEVNVACFHPLVGGGLVYGTKEGKLRILQYEGRHSASCSEQSFFQDENTIEVERRGLEC
ncbi:unnamed protein product [Spirodela intermedia]|uniref:Uncharacterized protein n=1 Tax=Spirodela intermedia TaxID=51605 RepID=A0A7I8L4S4_SPIIN|nr:unnamed protein product [Spirodela intermedia]